jgi:D-beta-D-heptose 7-phosphate kinase/D-beta-D-heptose 1-phosphate adenosyltransferase
MDIVSKFAGIRVLVVGDVMLDRYWWGDVNRISPEAPVPVVRLNRTTLAPGGAANVAANISGLGALPTLIGMVGADGEGEELCRMLEDISISTNGIIRVATRNTTVKTRLLAHNQQIARVDQESVEELSAEEEKVVMDLVHLEMGETDAVILSDYAKGLLSRSLMEKVIAAANQKGVPVVIDPKGREYSKYKGATILTPNRREAALACNLDDTGKPVVAEAGDRLLRELELSAALITEGEDGMTLFRNGNEPAHFPACAREVYDSTGAGDTVIATLAVGLGAGLPMEHVAELANIAAGIVVEHVGTVAVNINDLAASLASGAFRAAQ